jgi:hypothetical protein
MVQTAKKLVAGKGILSSPNVKPGKVLPPATAEMVKKFYVSDDISNIMPGPKTMFLSTLKARSFISRNNYLSLKEQKLGKLLGFQSLQSYSQQQLVC